MHKSIPHYDEYRKMYHATPRKLTSLDRDAEIYLATDADTAKYTAAASVTDLYVYEVYYPTSLRLFNPRSIFKDENEAQEVASFLSFNDDEYFDEDDYNFDEEFAIRYFANKINYTEEGWRILTSCVEYLDTAQIIETFVVLHPSTEILGRNDSCLLEFGYQGRFEQEMEFNVWVDIDECSVCVFDQRLCKLGDLVQSPNTRENPWNYERAYFRYGFWDMPSGENEIFHATVKYSDILKSGSLSPRAFRKSKKKTLGGRHDVSISFYGSIYRAMNTLLYLYRIWQLEHDFESIPFSEEEKKKVINLRTSSNYNIREILKIISHKYFETLIDPTVFSHSWVGDTEKEDFALITTLNPCKYMYKEYLGTRYGKGSNFPMFESPAFEELAKYVAYSSYFNSNRGNSLPSGSSQSGIYHSLKDAITNSKTHFEYDFGLNYWTKEPLRDEALARAVFGERSYFAETDRFTIGKNLYQFENITIDLNPQPLPIEDICEFYAGEQEFRLFREIPIENFKNVYTIEDIIEIATELNGGIEPLFWDFTRGESENYDLSKQKIATWEEKRENPSKEWFLGPNFLINNKDGYLINPDTNDIYWYHGMATDTDELDIFFPKESSTLYFTSNIDYAEEHSRMGVDVWEEEIYFVVYKVKIKIPSYKLFDVRKAMTDPSFKDFARAMLLRGTHFGEGLNTYEDAADFMHYDVYDYVFNGTLLNDLVNNGFLGWLETEDNVVFSPRNEEPLTVALLQDYSSHLVIVEEEYTL